MICICMYEYVHMYAFVYVYVINGTVRMKISCLESWQQSSRHVALSSLIVIVVMSFSYNLKIISKMLHKRRKTFRLVFSFHANSHPAKKKSLVVYNHFMNSISNFACQANPTESSRLEQRIFFQYSRNLDLYYNDNVYLKLLKM